MDDLDNFLQTNQTIESIQLFEIFDDVIDVMHSNILIAHDRFIYRCMYEAD